MKLKKRFPIEFQQIVKIKKVKCGSQEKGYNAIKDYYKRYLNIAKDFKTGFILESPTWRANPPDFRILTPKIKN
ncbi:MAG: hypothetical protein ABR503_16110 [Chitinophagaceae bacterium]